MLNIANCFKSPSFKFLFPFTLIAFFVCSLLYFTGIYLQFGTGDGYGWSNSILLDRVFNFMNIQVSRQFYIPIWVVFYIIISVPVQEYIFRVAPKCFIKNKLFYIVFTSLVFMLAHTYFMKPLSLALTLVMGIILAIEYDKNKNFWALCIFHFILASFAFTLNLA